MDFLAFVAVVAVFAVFVLPIGVIASLVGTRRRVAQLEQEVAALRRRFAESVPAVPDAAPRSAPDPDAAPGAMPADAIGPAQAGPEPQPEPQPDAPAEPAHPEPGRSPGMPERRPAGPVEPFWRRLEAELTARWLVWLGGAALALGGAFLAKYSFDQGLLGPGVRVALGLAVGLLLVVGSEYVLRRDPRVEEGPPWNVPAALAAGGMVTLFATLFAAFSLFGLLPALLAFLLLGLVSIAAVLLALRHGVLMALLGLVGGFAVPLIVHTGQGGTAGLVLYVAPLVAAALAVARVRHWWWLGWCALVGPVFYQLARMMAPVTATDVALLGLFDLLVLASFLAFREGLRQPAWLAPDGPPARQATVQVGIAAVALLLMQLLLVLATGFMTAALVLFVAFSALLLANGRRDPDYDLWPIAAAVLAGLLLASWILPVTPAQLEGREPWPDDSYAVVAVVLAILFGGGGYAALWGAARAGRFAAISAAMPITVLAVSYYRFTGLEVTFAWSAAALGLAALALLPAQQLVRWQDQAGPRAALAAYAAAVVAGIALAATMALREAWLTVVLSLLLPALGWIQDRLRVSGLRVIALVVAGVVLIRLLFNGGILDYAPAVDPILSWILYGYGVPAVAFFAAARLFRREQDDRLVALLEGGTISFTVALISLSIRNLLHDGDLAASAYDLLERSLMSLGWLVTGSALLLRGAARPVPLWAGRVLVAAATLHIAGAQVVMNPLVSGEPVGEWPILDRLLLAYAAPALVYAILWLSPSLRHREPLVARLAGLAAILLAFVHVSLEIRHLFHGPRLDRGVSSEAELYSYSAAWLVMAGVVIAAGIRTAIPALRHAGLVLILLTVAKVFLIDMAGLQGLWRAVSFLGLGLVLVGIGWIYRRFTTVRSPA